MKRNIRQQYSKKYGFIRLDMEPIFLDHISQHWINCGGYNDQPYFDYYYGSDAILAEFLLTYTEHLNIKFVEIK